MLIITKKLIQHLVRVLKKAKLLVRDIYVIYDRVCDVLNRTQPTKDHKAARARPPQAPRCSPQTQRALCEFIFFIFLFIVIRVIGQMFFFRCCPHVQLTAHQIVHFEFCTALILRALALIWNCKWLACYWPYIFMLNYMIF
jgi:hypothetical protein